MFTFASIYDLVVVLYSYILLSIFEIGIDLVIELFILISLSEDPAA
jgi:hypothetical protein